jgi:FG-GAP repeat protein/VCBS repeat protein/flagellar hook capping protein FlgD
MFPRSRHLRPSLFAIVFLVISLAPATTQLRTTTEPGALNAPSMAVEPDAQRAGVDAGWWQNVSAQIARDEYHPSLTSEGLQAPNRAQGLRTLFRTGGIEVVPRQHAGTWNVSWSTTRWGREGNLQTVDPIAPRAEGVGERVHYAHPGLDEWYENTAAGLEQGFTVETRPEGEGWLHLVGRFDGALRAQLRDSAVDLINAQGACVLHYGDLHVWDARGQALDARLSMDGEALAIQVDDHAARYPLTIDPLMTSPAWTAESNQASANLGSVATAGDVNGDGYSDVIVGAYVYDAGETNEGRALLFLGSPSGLATSPAWTAESNQASGFFGYSVGTAGDVNGDGYDDVIVGAYGYDNGETDEGRAYLYNGSATGLSATPSWSAESDQAGAQYGYSVATAGDVNGDGYDDVIVGAHLYDVFDVLTNAGRAYVYSGSAGGLIGPSWVGQGGLVDDFFGRSVGTAGDVNGDGYDDIIVGSEGAQSPGETDEGRVYVFPGSATGIGVYSAWIGEGGQGGAAYGHSVATAGDVNGDGYADVIIGANQFNGVGRAFVYHGSAAGLASAPAWIGDGVDDLGQYGYSVATAGDINGDGYSDVIVGELAGAAFVYLGSGSGIATSPVWTQGLAQANTQFGRSVATAGDVNGDGYSDVIVGAFLYDNGQLNEGGAFVYHGSPAGLATSAAWITEGDQDNVEYGTSVATAGDVNGDGYSDVIVGARFYDSGEVDEGWVFVYYGSSLGLATAPSWSIEGGQGAAYLGTSVGTAGDVNGDGFADVIVGAPGYDAAEPDMGKVLVYYGSATGLGLSPAWTAYGPFQLGAYFGQAVGAAGDVNGDGFGDVIVGAPTADAGQPDEGVAYVYQGSATGLGPSPAWTAQSNQGGANFGGAVATAGDVNRDGYSDVIVGAYRATVGGFVQSGLAFVYQGTSGGLTSYATWYRNGDDQADWYGISVGSAGDVNGDGYSDVIVGASSADNGEGLEGMAYVYHGSVSGLSTTPAWTGEANQAVAYYGTSVGTAGDVNGDGYSDIIVGAYLYDSGQTDEGRAFLYHGSATGIVASPAWTGDGNQTNAEYGNSVGTAGDVNGDGYSDVIVGAWYYNNGQIYEGRAFTYYGNGGDGLDCIPRQARINDSALIPLLGRADPSASFRIKALGRSPAGRGKVQLQWEVKRVGIAFDGTNLVSGLTFDSGAPAAGVGSAFPLSEAVLGLDHPALYHWRLRLVTDCPFLPHSRWLSPPGNAPSETDLRTPIPYSSTGVPDSPVSSRLLLETGSPNPFSNTIQLAYTQPERGRVRLTIYDIAGREVAVLADGTKDSGPHTETWDGRGLDGTQLPEGVYFARIEFAGKTEARKIVLAR